MSLLLIGIAAWGIGFGLISSFRVVGVAIAVGIFLFFIALVGLIGAVKHHQVLLFFVSFSVLHGLQLGSSSMNNCSGGQRLLLKAEIQSCFGLMQSKLNINSQLHLKKKKKNSGQKYSLPFLKILKYFNFFRAFKVSHCIINPSHCVLNPKAT